MLISALPFPGGFPIPVGDYLWKETDVPIAMYLDVPNIAVQEEPAAPRTYFPETWLWDMVPVG